MKAFILVQRLLLGAIFVVSGVGGFVHSAHPHVFATSLAREYMAVMQATPYAHVLFGLQIICGVLLITGRFVPLTLAILAAFLFNIFMFHVFLETNMNPVSVLAALLWLLLFVEHRRAFRSLLQPKFSGL